jgi:hypothetical protein
MHSINRMQESVYICLRQTTTQIQKDDVAAGSVSSHN